MSISGELLLWKTIGENGSDYFAGLVGGTLIETNDGNFAFCCEVQNSSTVYGTLVKLNKELDTIWKRNYYTENYRTMTVKVFQTQDQGFIITGNVVPEQGYYYNILLIKTDSIGNMEWYKTYGDYYAEHGRNVIETPDGGYLIGGFRWNPPEDHSLDAMVIKTDSLGNEQWTKYFGNPTVDDGMALVALADDGNYLVATVWGVNITSSLERRGRIWMLKLDSNGNIIYENKIGDINRSEHLKNFRKTESGYILSGFFVDSTFITYKGFLLKTNDNFDSIWMRKYYYYNNLYDYNYFYDAYPTTDNGYIAVGKARPDMGESTSKLWVVKVDSMGCDTPGCATGTFVKELPIQAGSAGELAIWPNPAREEFRIAPPVTPERGKSVRIFVYNSQGIRVKEIKPVCNNEPVTVNTGNWQKGIYYIRMSAGGRSLGSGKVVVE